MANMIKKQQCPYTKERLMCPKVNKCVAHDCVARQTAKMLAKARNPEFYTQGGL